MPKGKDGAERLIDSIVSALNGENNGQMTPRNAENVVCKAFCISRDTDERFDDLITKGQHVYEILQDGIILHRGNAPKLLLNGCIIKKWNWRNEMVDIETLLHVLTEKLDVDVDKFIIPLEFRKTRGARYVHEHRDLFFERT